MSYRLFLAGVLLAGRAYSAPIQVTINLSGGSYDRGVTTPTLDTEATFTTATAYCTGAGCPNASFITALNNLLFGFSVPSASATGAGASLTGSLLGHISAFTFTGQNSYSQNASFSENIAATGIDGVVGSLTGTFDLSFSGNSTQQARSATGTITLTGDVAASQQALAAVPEPSTITFLFMPMLGLLFRKRHMSHIFKR